jgi:hypothetical protein
VAPDTVKPVPVTVAALTVTAAVPVELNVIVRVAAIFTPTLPNATLVALMLNVGAVAFNCRAKLLETPALAVSVTACAEVTDDTLAVNRTLVAFAGIVTLAGTLTTALLLARLTLTPPLGAAALSVTVQLSLPAPVIEALLQVSPLSVGAGGAGETAEKVVICMTQGPAEVNVAVALLLPAVVIILSSAISPSGDVIARDVNPLPAPVVRVATMFAPKTNSFALLVVAEPLLALALLPLAPAVTPSAVTPRYSRMRTSGYDAAWLKVTVTVLLPLAMFAA